MFVDIFLQRCLPGAVCSPLGDGCAPGVQHCDSLPFVLYLFAFLFCFPFSPFFIFTLSVELCTSAFCGLLHAKKWSHPQLCHI